MVQAGFLEQRLATTADGAAEANLTVLATCVGAPVSRSSIMIAPVAHYLDMVELMKPWDGAGSHCTRKAHIRRCHPGFSFEGRPGLQSRVIG